MVGRLVHARRRRAGYNDASDRQSGKKARSHATRIAEVEAFGLYFPVADVYNSRPPVNSFQHSCLSVMTSIVDSLLKQISLSDETLGAAERRAAQMGVRLETSLLDAGDVSEGQLELALADYHRMPAARAVDLADIAEAAYGLLTAEQAARYRAVPFATGRGRVDIAVGATLDPTRLDELAFVLSQRVRIFIATEPRLAQALARYYGRSLPAHLINLVDRLDRRPKPAEPGAASRVTEPVGTASSPAAGDSIRKSRDTQSFRRAVRPPAEPDPPRKIELSDEERTAIFGGVAPPATRAHPPESAERVPENLVELDSRLRESESPTAVCEAFLDHFASDFPSSLVLRPEGDLFRGWLARGASIEETPLREIMTGPGLAREWREAITDTDWSESTLGASAAASGVSKILGAGDGASAALAAVRVRDRLVCIALGTGASVDSRRMAVQRHAALLTGMALERWILGHKTGAKGLSER